jgi:hypothetical protein
VKYVSINKTQKQAHTEVAIRFFNKGTKNMSWLRDIFSKIVLGNLDILMYKTETRPHLSIQNGSKILM